MMIGRTGSHTRWAERLGAAARPIALGLLVSSGVGTAPRLAAQDVAETAKMLVSEDLAERFTAIHRVRAMESVPPSLVTPLVGFIQEELRRAILPPAPAPGAKPGEPFTDTPTVGDETSLVRIKADPRKHFDGEFILCGGVSVSTYYNFGYSNASESYYSFRFRQLTKDAKPTRDVATLYLPRRYGPALSEVVTRVTEGGAGGKIARLRCTIRSDRCERPENATDSIEILDWQFYDRGKKKWEPWAFEGFNLGMVELSMAGEAGAAELVKMVAAESNTKNAFGDFVLRYTSTVMLGEMDQRCQQLAANQLKERLKSARSDAAIDAIESAMLKLPEPEKTKAEIQAIRDEEAATKARAETAAKKKFAEKVKSLLNQGLALEKINPKAAIQYFKDVVKLAPGSAEAKAAQDRINVLSKKK